MINVFIYDGCFEISVKIKIMLRSLIQVIRLVMIQKILKVWKSTD